MGEIVIRRDDRGRIVGLSARDVDRSTFAGGSAHYFLLATSAALSEYLHVPVVRPRAEDGGFVIDRSDSHLDREIDAVLETIILGLRMVEREFPTDLVVQEATIGVEV